MATYFIYNSKIHVEQTSYDEDAVVAVPTPQESMTGGYMDDDFGYDKYAKGYDTYTGIFTLSNKQYKR